MNAPRIPPAAAPTGPCPLFGAGIAARTDAAQDAAQDAAMLARSLGLPGATDEPSL